MSLSWKRIGVERYEWVLGFMFFKAVVQGKEAREVFCVGDESCPYCFESVVCTPSVKEFQACLSSTQLLSQSRPFCGIVKRYSNQLGGKIKMTNIT